MILAQDSFELESSLSLYRRGVSFAVCDEGIDEAVCLGTSTPVQGSKPLFYVTCEDTTYLGHDPYGLSVVEAGRRRPWYCFDDDGALIGSTRPKWHLIGYFPEGSCANVTGRGVVYNESVCEHGGGYTTSSPTTTAVSVTSTTTMTTTPSTTPEVTTQRPSSDTTTPDATTQSPHSSDTTTPSDVTTQSPYSSDTTPTPSDILNSENSEKSDDNTVLIAASVGGGVIVILLLVLAFFTCRGQKIDSHASRALTKNGMMETQSSGIGDDDAHHEL